MNHSLHAALLDAAHLRFGELSSCEQELFRSVEEGKDANCLPSDAKDDASDGEAWPPSRTIKADRIVWLVMDPRASGLIPPRGVAIVGARVDGLLDLSFAKGDFPIDFRTCAFTGALRFSFAEFRALRLVGAYLHSFDAPSLRLQGALFFRGNHVRDGRVALIGARIGDDADFSGTVISNREGEALVLDGARVFGAVLLTRGFHATGSVRLLQARIERSLDVIGAHLEKNSSSNRTGRIALDAEGAFVGSYLQIAASQIDGGIDLNNIHVGGTFTLSPLKSQGITLLDLRRAHVGVLFDQAESWPSRGTLRLNDFQYTRIDDRSPSDLPTRLAWLDLQSSFSPQPYEQLANVLRKTGKNDEADRILIEKERHLARRDNFLWYLIGWPIGYGYDSMPALWITVAEILFGAFIFKLAHRQNILVHATPDVQDAKSELFHSLLFSIEMFLPVLNFGVARQWRIKDGTLGASWISYVRVWHICVGRLLTSLLAVALAGVLKS